MICNAVHPQAAGLLANGVTIEPCQLDVHAEGRHVFQASAPKPPTVVEAWTPQEGDYVRIDISPECQALHARLPLGVDAVYGRVEIVDRTWDDPATWINVSLKEGEDVADMLESAHTSRGHFYYVSDALDSSRYLLIDGQHAAAELTPVSELEARFAIERLRARMDTMTPNEKMLARIGLAGVRRAS